MTEEVMSVPLILYFLENWHGNLQSSASICASQTQVVGEKSQLTLLGSHMLAFFFFLEQNKIIHTLRNLGSQWPHQP